MPETSKKAENYDPERFAENMAKLSDYWQQLVQKCMEQGIATDGSGLVGPASALSAYTEFMQELLSDPARLMEMQMNFYKDYMALIENTTARFLGKKEEPLIEPGKGDKRFRDAAWQESLLFDFIKQSYLLTSRWMQKAATNVDGLDKKVAEQIDFYTRQFADALSPSNFPLTNPEVLRATLETNGENLAKGLKNLLEDVEESKEMFTIQTADKQAFEVGKNLAATKGKVIYQNDLMQLIQYAPTTKTVYKTPLLIIAPWINKYYILDMQEKNSFVKWLVDQGHTVFITSWVNPDKELADKSFEDYMKQGPLEAIEAIEKATGEKEINIIGYCLGGTLLAATLAWLKAKKQHTSVQSATFLTTLIDFEKPGEIAVFIDEQQLDVMEKQMKEKGYFSGREMMTVFSMLRANDMIWNFVVNNYLLGKEPFPFDLLYWNSDATHLPAAMHVYYLRNMYQKNLLKKPGGLTLCGAKIDITTIETPSYFLSTKEDHIAPWQATYAATQIFKGPVRFVLSASGHVAGVVNPPANEKYCYWTNSKNPKKAEEWLKSAKEKQYSWWEDWNKWMGESKFADGKIPARTPGDGKLKPIEDAPGSYVKVRF